MKSLHRQYALVLGLGVLAAGIAASPAQASATAHGKVGDKTTIAAPFAAMRSAAGASGTSAAGRTPGRRPGAAEGTAPRPAAVANANPRWAGYYYGPVTVDPGGSEWVEVYCPAGMLATSGGESNSSAGGVTLHGTYGLGGGSG